MSRSSWIVGIACLLLSAAVMAGSPPSGRSARGFEPRAPLPAPVPGESVSGGELSLAERVAYQRRIEEVYWRHTTWPKANPRPKPPLAQVLSDAAIRSKVDDALRKSSTLAVYWRRPITAEQLQAEMERMARGTRHPEVLRELFAALDDDPFVIAECLARPALADRLLRNWYAFDDRFHGAVRTAAQSAMGGGVTAAGLPTVAERYEEVVFELERDRDGAGLSEVAPSSDEARAFRLGEKEWSDEVRRLAGRFGARGTALPEPGPTDDEIDALFAEIPLGAVGALEESVDGWRAVTVLSKAMGSVRLGIAQWPKQAFSTWWSASREDLESATGPVAGAYTLPMVSAEVGCTADTWRISVQGPPFARYGHTAVWTGDRMIVWGGGLTLTNTGGVYDPATDSWTPTAVEGAPSARDHHTAVYTGSEMLIWGGLPPSIELGAYCAGAPTRTFISPECGSTIHVAPGETVEFTVTAEDAEERNVTLNASNLPRDAVMSPALPVIGNPVSSNFTWVTDASDDNTTHVLQFTATNDAAESRTATCSVTVHVRQFGEYALEFEGTQWVDGTNSALPQGNAARTMEAWIKPSVLQDSTIFNYGKFATNKRAGILDAYGRLYFVGEWNDVIGSIVLPVGEWTHVAVSYDGSSMTLYVNGVVDVTAPLPAGPLDTTGFNWRIGNGSDIDYLRQPFIGPIDEVRVWDHARTQAEINAAMEHRLSGDEPGLVAYYRLDDGPGSTTTADSSPSVSNGVLDGTDALPDWVDGYPKLTGGPIFRSPACGTTIHVAPGETVELTVTAEDAPERTVTLDATGLPPDAITDPALPISGNPVSSDVTWTTDDSDRNTVHNVVFTAVDDRPTSTRCEVTIEVGEGGFVTLTSFAAASEDGQITLQWTTETEIDTAGFYLLRHDLHTGETIRLNQVLIPAEGDVFSGANYGYTDDTALNGVEYAYTLVDVDLYGIETRFPEVRAVPNPPNSPVKLLSPAYGATLSPEEIPVFDWTPKTGRGQWIVISTDPTFTDPSKAVRIEPGQRRIVVPGADGTRPVPPIWTDLLALDEPLYWRIEPSGAPGGVVYSDTYFFRYADR